MPELDQQNLKEGYLETLRLAVQNGWGGLFRVVIFIVICSAIAFTGWGLYTGSAKSVIQIFNHQASLARVNEDSMDDVARTLVKRVQADAVVFARMDWGTSGDRTILRIYLKDGSRYKALDGERDPIFSSNKAALDLIFRLGAGEIPCSKLGGASNMLQIFYLDQGFTYRCAVSIPPESSQFSGYIAVAWKDKATADGIENLEEWLRVSAERATKRP